MAAAQERAGLVGALLTWCASSVVAWCASSVAAWSCFRAEELGNGSTGSYESDLQHGERLIQLFGLESTKAEISKVLGTKQTGKVCVTTDSVLPRKHLWSRCNIKFFLENVDFILTYKAMIFKINIM